MKLQTILTKHKYSELILIKFSFLYETVFSLNFSEQPEEVHWHFTEFDIQI